MQLNTAIINAKLWTGAKGTQADAVGIVGESIAMISDTQTVLKRCDASTVVIDAQQGLLVPGFTDCHCHFLDGGLRLRSVQLRDVKTLEQFAERVALAAAAQPPGSWILGGDWDHYNWGGDLPHRSWIDAITPNHPVWLNRVDGHMCLANACALKIAGISAETPDIAGGEIIRDHNGPTGILKDNAQNLVTPFIPQRTQLEKMQALEAAMTHVAARGVTAVHTMVTVDCSCGLWPQNLGVNAEHEDMEAAFDELEVYRSAQRDRLLRTRIRAALPLASWSRLQAEIQSQGRGDDWLRVGGLKAMLDGSLGSHTAAMLTDYDDKPGDRGHLIWDPAILERLTYEASAAGLQVMVHAIGDEAVRKQLDIFARVKQALPDHDLRLRIEHAQHMTRADIPRFGQLGVIASLQMSHLADDGCWAKAVIGDDRLQTSWPMRSLLASGATVVLGSDWFVTQPDPLAGIYAAVTRRTKDGAHPGGLAPEERVTVTDALRAYTVDAAFAAFEEDRRGTIEVGKLADLVLLDRDLLSIDVEEIPQTRVLVTIVGGQIVSGSPNV